MKPLDFLKKLLNKKNRYVYQRVYIDRNEGIEFIYYAPKKNGSSIAATLNWLRDKRNKINANIDFSYGELKGMHGIKATFNDTGIQKLIPQDRVLLLSRGRLEIVEPRCIELLYGSSIAKL